MKKSHIATIITTLVLIVYVVSLQITMLFKVALILFLLLHVLLVWMVLTILQEPYQVKHGFNERFYQDKSNDDLGLM